MDNGNRANCAMGAVQKNGDALLNNKYNAHCYTSSTCNSVASVLQAPMSSMRAEQELVSVDRDTKSAMGCLQQHCLHGQ